MTHMESIKNMKHCRVAFLWDESFLWGLMAYKALRECSLPFELIRAEDIRAGVLDRYRMLFVPGGWASNKRKALGDAGVKAILDFVGRGGNYLGICGGAGLATRAENGIGLLNITRKKSEDRVPSFNGRIRLNIKEHPMWERQNSHIFHAWWPSQFQIGDSAVRILATYGDALPDSFSSDLNVGDVNASGDWSELEKIYQINLDPERLRDESAVVEGHYGKGTVILSLIHFDTPDDINGQVVLKNLWWYLAGESPDHKTQSSDSKARRADNKGQTADIINSCSEICTLCSELISLGERNFLWFWRNPMLLLWRRGVRGLEYNTLYIMLKEISDILRVQNHDLKPQDIDKIREKLIPFVDKARRLLMLERYALQNGHITYERCEDPEIQKIRMELFSSSKHHGGLFKRLIDEVDRVLFSLITKAT